MRRADRLFEILQVLRRASGPMTAEAIAIELETSRRTIYRDIAALMARRVPIRGEAGLGYVLDRGFDLPPLMLTTDEIEAVALGAQWVVAHGEERLSRAALDVLAKVAAIVPAGLRPVIDDPVVGTPPPRDGAPQDGIDVARLRDWCRAGRKLSIGYVDEAGRASGRVVWPFLVGYFASSRALIAWCETREDFRVFLTGRITSVDYLDETYPERPAVLRRRWRQANAGSTDATTASPAGRPRR